MSRLLNVSLGILTSIGGFLDVGSLATSAQAGALFGYSLLWAILLGTVCLIFLVEMAGRFSAVSRHTIVGAMRMRFGFPSFLVPFAAGTLVHLLVLAAEIGGVCVGLQLLTGIGFQRWAIPVALALWLLLWLGTFETIEKGSAILGLVTVCFVVAVLVLLPGPREAAAGFVPTLPPAERPQYLFLAVSILGATISPYMFFFYSSGAIEDKWNESDLGPNRLVAIIGMGFGSTICMAVLVVAAVVLQPAGIRVDDYEQAAWMLVPAFPRWGFYLFVASLVVACFGAALELSLTIAYTFAQGFGWNWGANAKPAHAARFSLTYTASIALSALIVLIGLNPLRLTLFSMALTALILPLTLFPFLVLMNDEKYMGKYRNGPLSNLFVILSILLASVIALVALPLQIIGSP